MRLLIFWALALAGVAGAQTTIYSDFGPGNSFTTTGAGWCVSGATTLNCGPAVVREIAVPFTSAQTLNLDHIDMALSHNSGTNSVQISLHADLGNRPGQQLYTWIYSSLPAFSGTAIITVGASIAIQAGQQYWIVASAVAADSLDFWAANNQGLGGGLGGDGNTWSPLSGQNLPAFAVYGAPITYPVTIDTNPTGLKVVVDTFTYFAPHTFNWPAGDVHSIGVTSPQAGSNSQYAYNGWNDSGAQTHNITVQAASASYVAAFKTQYPLATSASPGGSCSVNASPAPQSGNYYDSGTSVQLTASPNSGFQFANWSGDLSGTANPQTLAMTTARTATANCTAAVPCVYGLSATSATYGAAASSGNTVTVTPTANCGSWSSSSSVSWVVITSGNGTGTGNVTYNVLANTGSASRSTTLTIAGQPFTVTQAGLGCQFSFSPGTAS